MTDNAGISPNNSVPQFGTPFVTVNIKPGNKRDGTHPVDPGVTTVFNVLSEVKDYKIDTGDQITVSGKTVEHDKLKEYKLNGGEKIVVVCNALEGNKKKKIRK